MSAIHSQQQINHSQVFALNRQVDRPLAFGVKGIDF